MATSDHLKRHRQAVDAAKHRIALFKAAWMPQSRREKNRTDITETFTCSVHHVLCQPVEPVFCSCKRRPAVDTELVELYTCQHPLTIIVHPSLERNQAYLDLVHHTPFHRTITEVTSSLVVTFADVAVSAGNLELLRHLLDAPQPCIRNFFAEHYSYKDFAAVLRLFLHAMNGGSEEVVMYLVEKFSEQLTGNAKLAVLEICLWLATTDKRLESCFQKLALRFGANLVGSEGKFCPLRLTCMYDDGDAAGILIDQGADMYRETSDGQTLAYCAYKYGQHTFGLYRVFCKMLEKGFDPDAVILKGSHFRTPLMYLFIHHSELKLVKLLVGRGRSVNAPLCFVADDREYKITPLMHTLECRSLAVAAWLIHQGADVNQCSIVSHQLNNDSWTPLHAAAGTDSLPMARLLVSRGARADAMTASGESVLSLALDRLMAGFAAFDVVTYLLQINVPVQCIPGSSFLINSRMKVQSEWCTPLDMAVMAGCVQAVEVLLQSGHYSGQIPQVTGLVVSLVLTTGSHSQRQALKLVEDAAQQVPALRMLCRHCLRAACGLRLLQYVTETVMPPRLRKDLLLEDVWGALDRNVEPEIEELN